MRRALCVSGVSAWMPNGFSLFDFRPMLPVAEFRAEVAPYISRIGQAA